MKNPYLFRPDTLYLGDCLEVMQSFVDAKQKVDLIYLDPPFNSKKNHSVLFKRDRKGRKINEQAQFIAFKDTWYWTEAAAQRVENIKNSAANPACDVMRAFEIMIPQTPMLAYLSYMTERLFIMHQLLKDTGTLYLHCDPSANAYLRLVLDAVFGKNNCRNEIIWHYGAGHPPKKDFARKHDTIFRYTKSNDYVFNTSSLNMRIPFKDIASKMHFTNVDEAGRKYRKYDSGKIAYLDEGKVVTNVWTDIDGQQARSPISKEYLGYPTQKPLKVLERIVSASSNKGDLVLDPFAGCGTTAEASFKLKRRFLGIDISAYAIRQICTTRLKDATNIEIMGLPTDFASAKIVAKEKPFIFEQWAITCIPGMVPNDKQTGDGGVDGKGILLYKPIKDDKPEAGLVFAQVKGGGFVPNDYRALASQIHGGSASVGLFITVKKQKITPSMYKEITDVGNYSLPGGSASRPRLIFWSIEEYFNGIKPNLPELAHPFTGRAMPQQIPSTQRELET